MVGGGSDSGAKTAELGWPTHLHSSRLATDANTQKAGLLQLQGGTLAAALAEGLGGCSPADPMSWLSFLPLRPSGPK